MHAIVKNHRFGFYLTNCFDLGGHRFRAYLQQISCMKILTRPWKTKWNQHNRFYWQKGKPDLEPGETMCTCNGCIILRRRQMVLFWILIIIFALKLRDLPDYYLRKTKQVWRRTAHEMGMIEESRILKNGVGSGRIWTLLNLIKSKAGINPSGWLRCAHRNGLRMIGAYSWGWFIWAGRGLLKGEHISGPRMIGHYCWGCFSWAFLWASELDFRIFWTGHLCWVRLNVYFNSWPGSLDEVDLQGLLIFGMAT